MKGITYLGINMFDGTLSSDLTISFCISSLQSELHYFVKTGKL